MEAYPMSCNAIVLVSRSVHLFSSNMHAINDRTYPNCNTEVTRTSDNTTSPQYRSVSRQREIVSIVVDHFTGSSLSTSYDKKWKAQEPVCNDHELAAMSSDSETSASMRPRKRVR
jgi:hypothetical protein